MEKCKREYITSSELNLKYKFDLEQATTDCDLILQAHQKQTIQFLNLEEENTKIKEKLCILEAIERSQGPSGTQQKVTIIGSISDLNKEYMDVNDYQIKDLKKKNCRLEQKLSDAYALIHELQFEVDSVSYYENENESLTKQIEHIRNEIEQYKMVSSKDVVDFEIISVTDDDIPTKLDVDAHLEMEQQEKPAVELH